MAEKIFRPIHYFVMFGERGMTMMPVVPVMRRNATVKEKKENEVE